MNNEECLICNAPLEYLDKDIDMECEICHKTIKSKTRCINKHFVCDTCHKKGLDSIIGLVLNEDSKDPIKILNKMMMLKFCHMHGPEHHTLVGVSLLTAYKNAYGYTNFDNALYEMFTRSNQIPGGTCGFFGACGAAISTGIFMSIITKSNPLSEKPFALSNEMTSRALHKIAEIGGPRCCKRDSYLSILSAIKFLKEKLNIELEKSEIKCFFKNKNNQCIKDRCPFYNPN